MVNQMLKEYIPIQKTNLIKYYAQAHAVDPELDENDQDQKHQFYD
jgi:hypothetical protein